MPNWGRALKHRMAIVHATSCGSAAYGAGQPAIHPARTLCRAALAIALGCLLLVPGGPARAGDSLGAVSPTDAPKAVADANADPTYRHVMVELTAAPAAVLYTENPPDLFAAAPDAADLAAATRAQVAVVAGEQETFLAAAAPLGGQTLYRLQRVYNGVALRVPAESIHALAELDGVAAVHPLRPKRPDNTVSVPYIGAPVLWATTAPSGTAEAGKNGLTGKGMTIAVIDTGVDYLHATFGGSGAYAQNDPTIIGDVAGFPGLKVIGGYDFAGDDYDADPESETYNPIPNPDPDPADCYNHGTHVAGTAAGFGVTAPGGGSPGGTYLGPYDATTFERQFAVGPGVAPEAQIIALKVFGCEGSSDLTELAIEWAVDPNGDGDFSDRVDVINLSLGSPYGSVYEPSAVAANNAARMGIVVVASAGNSGDTYFATGTPAVADRVISVAATDDHLLSAGAGFVPVDAVKPDVSVAGFSARGPRRQDWVLKPDIAAPGRGIVSAVGGDDGRQGLRLSGTSMAAPHVAGAAALLRQADPTRRVEEVKALLMNTARLQTGTATMLSPTRTGAGLIDLPAVLPAPAIITADGAGGRVSLSFAPIDVIDRHVAVESVRIVNRSSEPISYTVGYVPILNAPGVEIAPERPTVTVAARGVATMPIRMTAEANALRHSRDPNVPDTQTFPRHWISEESGHLLFWPEQGRLETQLDLTNMGGAAAGITALSLQLDPALGRLTVQLAGSNFTLLETDGIALFHGRAETGGGTLVATLDVDRAEKHAGVATQIQVAEGTVITGSTALPAHVLPALAQGELYLQLQRAGTQILEVRGQVTASGPVLHLPVYATARPLADLRAQSDAMEFIVGASLEKNLLLEGVARKGTDRPGELVSLVSALELVHADGNDLPYPLPDGQADIFDHADIQYVGLTSNVGLDPNGPVAERTLYFGISTHAEWTSPNEVEFSVFVDSDEDGEDDFRLYNADVRGYEAGSTRTSDAFVTVVEDLRTGGYSPPQFLNALSSLAYDTRPYGTNVMLLPVKAAHLGLSDGNPDFNYRVESMSNEAQDPVDETPALAADLSRPVYDLFGQNLDAPLMQASPDDPISVRIEPANYELAGQPDLLLIHYHNRDGTRSQVIDVRLTWPETIYLPYLIRR